VSTTPNPNTINTSLLGMLSAVIASFAQAFVTTAVQGNVAIEKLFKVVIHGLSAGEYIAKAGEKRAEIYGASIEKNGTVAEREQELKHQLRLKRVEDNEKPVAVGKPKAKPRAKASGKPVTAT